MTHNLLPQSIIGNNTQSVARIVMVMVINDIPFGNEQNFFAGMVDAGYCLDATEYIPMGFSTPLNSSTPIYSSR